MSTELVTVERESARPSTYRDYSPEFKAEALALVKANGYSIYRAARELDISEDTLRYWVRTEDRYREFKDRKVAELSHKYEVNLHRLADDLLETDLSKATVAAKATAIGILTEKMLLLRGQPTSIIATATIDDLRELQLAAQSVAQSQQIPVYDACLRLAEELNDVPELAQQLRTWAEAELKGKQ